MSVTIAVLYGHGLSSSSRAMAEERTQLMSGLNPDSSVSGNGKGRPGG